MEIVKSARLEVLPQTYDNPSIRWKLWRAFVNDWREEFALSHATGGRDAYLNQINKVIIDSKMTFCIEGRKDKFDPTLLDMNSKNLSNFAGVPGDSGPKAKTSIAVLRYIHCYLLAKNKKLNMNEHKEKTDEVCTTFQKLYFAHQTEKQKKASKVVIESLAGVYAGGRLWGLFMQGDDQYKEEDYYGSPPSVYHPYSGELLLLCLKKSSVDGVLLAHMFYFHEFQYPLLLEFSKTGYDKNLIMGRKTGIGIPFYYKQSGTGYIDFNILLWGSSRLSEPPKLEAIRLEEIGNNGYLSGKRHIKIRTDKYWEAEYDVHSMAPHQYLAPRGYKLKENIKIKKTEIPDGFYYIQRGDFYMTSKFEDIGRKLLDYFGSDV